MTNTAPRIPALLVAASCLLASVAPTDEPAPARRPNIIVVLIDDMGWADFSCFGNKDAKTPDIERLAAEGLRFEQFYAIGHYGKWHMGGQRDVDDAPPITAYGFNASLTNFEGMGPKLLPLTLKPGDDKLGRIRFDGVALPATLLGRSEASRGQPLFFRRPSDRAAFSGDHNLPDLAVRDGRWKLLCNYDGSSPQLYDLDGDPSEQNNLADTQAAETARLTAAAVAWHRSLPADNGATYQPPARRTN